MTDSSSLISMKASMSEITMEPETESHPEKTTLGRGPFQCLYCQRRFPRRSLLEQHLRIHTGEQPFQCTLCGRRFSQRGNLTKHMRAHNDCRKRKRLSGAHLQQEATHLIDRHCVHDGCSEVFKDAASLRLHLLSSAPSLLAELSFLKNTTICLVDALQTLVPCLSIEQQVVLFSKLEVDDKGVDHSVGRAIEKDLSTHLAAVRSSAEHFSTPQCQACLSYGPSISKAPLEASAVPSRLDHTCDIESTTGWNYDGKGTSCDDGIFDDDLLHLFCTDENICPSAIPLDHLSSESEVTLLQRHGRFDTSCGWPDNFGLLS